MSRLIEKTVNYSAVISNSIVMIILFCIIMEIVSRAVFDMPIQGVTEISGFLMVPMYFFGVSYVQFRKEHIKVDFLLSRLSPRMACFQSLLTCMIILIIFTIIGYFGIIMTIDSYQTAEFRFTVPFLPIWIIRIFVPIGAFLMWVLVFAEFIAEIRKMFQGVH